jgi:hypothetical protein
MPKVENASEGLIRQNHPAKTDVRPGIPEDQVTSGDGGSDFLFFLAR